MSDAPIFQLVYLSSAARELTLETATHSILPVARGWNQSVGVTGLLLIFEGNILQVLEGPESAVRETFGKISRDPRHFGIILLLLHAVARRDFPDWSMGFRETTSAALNERMPGFSEMLSNREAFRRESAEKSPRVRLLLESFARSVRYLA